MGEFAKISYWTMMLILLAGLSACGGGGSDGGNSVPGVVEKYQKNLGTIQIPSSAEITVIADFNNDGLDDIVTGRDNKDDTETAMSLLLSNGDGTFTNGTISIFGYTPMMDAPVGASGDYNNDGLLDLVIFDAGYYTDNCPLQSGRCGVGNEPKLYLSNTAGGFDTSIAIADAVEYFNVVVSPQRPTCSKCPPSGRIMHVKRATNVDINNDGFLDIFVESTGGANITSHFYMNNGDGTFTLDHDNRLLESTHLSLDNGYWRHLENTFVDVDGDGYLDLVMGVMREAINPSHINADSFVILNDGNGFFPVNNRITLPRTNFNNTWTEVTGILTEDVNNDGSVDLIFAHERRADTGNPSAVPFTGRYLQVLINDGMGNFTDETAQRMGDQTETTTQFDTVRNFSIGNSPIVMLYKDINEDGYPDLVMNSPRAWVSSYSPPIYLNDGRGNFLPEDVSDLLFNSIWFGFGMMPIELTGDGRTDFVTIRLVSGSDGIFGTSDDETNYPTVIRN